MFIQNNSNMQRSSKSIVVKQRGAAGAGRLPTGHVNPAGTERARTERVDRSGERGARRLASPGRTRAFLRALGLAPCILGIKYI